MVLKSFGGNSTIAAQRMPAIANRVCPSGMRRLAFPRRGGRPSMIRPQRVDGISANI